MVCRLDPISTEPIPLLLLCPTGTEKWPPGKHVPCSACACKQLCVYSQAADNRKAALLKDAEAGLSSSGLWVPQDSGWEAIQTPLCARLGCVCWISSSQSPVLIKCNLLLCIAHCHFFSQHQYKELFRKIQYKQEEHKWAHWFVQELFFHYRRRGTF